MADSLAFVMCVGVALLGRGLFLDSAAPGVAAGRLLVGLLAGAVVVLRPAVLRRSSVGWWLAALMALGVMSLLPRSAGSLSVPLGGSLALTYPADLGAGVNELLRLGLLWLILGAALRVRRGTVLSGLLCGAAWLALVGLREYLPNLRSGAVNWRVFAGFVNPNQFAAYLVAVLPVVVAATNWCGHDGAVAQWLGRSGVAKAGAKLRILVIVVAVLVLLCLGLTGSKGGLMAAVVGGLAAALALGLAGHRRAAGLAVLGLAGGAVLALVGPLRARLLSLALQANSQQFRLLTWGGTVDLIKAHPWLGCGLGGWALAYGPFAHAGFTRHAHSDWLTAWAELGIGGFLLLGGLYLAIARDAWRRLREPYLAALGAAALASVAGLVVAGAVDSTWSITAVSGSLMLVAAVVATPLSAPRRPRRGAGAVPALMLLGLLAHTVSEVQRAAGQAAAAAGDATAAADDYRTALGWAPWNGSIFEDLAGVSVAAGEEPVGAYAEALRRRPMSSRARYRLARALQRKGQSDQALPFAAQAVALNPLNLQPRLLVGELLEGAGRRDDALAAYRQLDQLAQSPALSVKALEYQLDTIHPEALLRIATLTVDPAERADARRRAVAPLDAYLATYAEVLAVAGDNKPLQQSLLAERGLSLADFERAQELRRLAAQ